MTDGRAVQKGHPDLFPETTEVSRNHHQNKKAGMQLKTILNRVQTFKSFV